MTNEKYTPELVAEGERVYDTIASVPAGNRFLVRLMTEAFINGMQAQERLTAQAGAEQESA